jgi:hypothetical protein
VLLELLKNYADIINGATRMTQRSATAMARTMLLQAGMEPAADMVTKLSEQMIAAQEAQYSMMRQMVQTEVDMTVARVGTLPTSEASTENDAQEMPEEITEPVESAGLTVVDESSAKSEPTPEPESSTAEPEAAPAEPEAAVTPPAPVKKAPAKRAPARKAPARKATTTKATTTKNPGQSTTSRTARPASTRKTASGSDSPGTAEPAS